MLIENQKFKSDPKDSKTNQKQIQSIILIMLSKIGISVLIVMLTTNGKHFIYKFINYPVEVKLLLHEDWFLSCFCEKTKILERLKGLVVAL